MRVGGLDILATAAVRDAADGRDFVTLVEKLHRHKVTVLEGNEEARLAALGVLCGTPNADGVVADLGGGSLELIALSRGRVLGDAATMPLGLLRLTEAASDDIGKAARLVDRHFNEIRWIGQSEGHRLYATGGAWRAIARVLIAQTGYPLHVLDNFTLEWHEATALLDLIAHQSKKSIEKIPGLSKKRLPFLPLAALILERAISHVRPSQLVFSVYGMREGRFYQRLPARLRNQDPLIAASEQLAKSVGRFPEHAEELMAWMAPLFQDEAPEQERLRHAACLLGDLFWNEHPDYRAEQAFLRVMRLPLMGLGHQDRAALALAIHTRYRGEYEPPEVAEAQALLSEETQIRAHLVGQALRTAHGISGGVPGVLGNTRLIIEQNSLVLEVPKADPVFAATLFDGRFDRLAKTIGLSRFVFQER